MSEVQNPFTFLRESIPNWLISLSEIERQIQDRHDEIAKVPVLVQTAVKKSDSTESIRPCDNITTRVDSDITPVDFASAAILKERKSSPALRKQMTRRKRKIASALSGHTSGPLKYRTRTMIVVYYNGEVQKAFETLVRNIGTGRNLLRKGKMVARMDALAEMAGSSDNSDDDPITAKVEYGPKFSVSNFRSTRTRAGLGNFSTTIDVGIESFDTADKALEKAQSLCECGAHQFLRDGDCRIELDGCRERFATVTKIAESEVQKFKEKEGRVRLGEVKSKDTLPLPSSAIEVDDGEEEEPTLASLGPIRLTSRA